MIVPATVDGSLLAFNPNTSGGGIYKSLSGPITARAAATNGQLGNGTKVNSLMPVIASSLANVTAIAAGALHTCALLESVW